MKTARHIDSNGSHARRVDRNRAPAPRQARPRRIHGEGPFEAMIQLVSRLAGPIVFALGLGGLLAAIL